MKKTDGSIAVNEDKKIAYVPQQAWIMNATVRENIIFGHEFEQERFVAIICVTACNNFDLFMQYFNSPFADN